MAKARQDAEEKKANAATKEINTLKQLGKLETKLGKGDPSTPDISSTRARGRAKMRNYNDSSSDDDVQAANEGASSIDYVPSRSGNETDDDADPVELDAEPEEKTKKKSKKSEKVAVRDKVKALVIVDVDRQSDAQGPGADSAALAGSPDDATMEKG
jgi:hypothetical protein